MTAAEQDVQFSLHCTLLHINSADWMIVGSHQRQRKHTFSDVSSSKLGRIDNVAKLLLLLLLRSQERATVTLKEAFTWTLTLRWCVSPSVGVGPATLKRDGRNCESPCVELLRPRAAAILAVALASAPVHRCRVGLSR